MVIFWEKHVNVDVFGGMAWMMMTPKYHGYTPSGNKGLLMHHHLRIWHFFCWPAISWGVGFGGEPMDSHESKLKFQVESART